MIVLDTHAWIWWVSDPSKLGRRGRTAIEAAGRIRVPAICCFEVAAAAARGRIRLDREAREWLEQALTEPRVELAPLTPAIAVMATRLAGFLGDPADRLIVATAMVDGVAVVTRDRKIREYDAVASVW